MNVLLLLVPVVLVFVGFQVAKTYIPWVENLGPLMKQFLILAGCVGGSMLYVKLGAPLPDDLRSMQSAAVIGLIQGLAALGTHGVKSAIGPTP